MDIKHLIGRFEEFYQWELRDHAEIKRRLDRMDEKLEIIQSFRWRTIGGASILAGIVTFVFEIIRVLR